MDISAGDMDISAGLIDISAGNMDISAGDMDISAGDMDISAGNMDISAGDMDISAGDMDISAGDIDISTGSCLSPNFFPLRKPIFRYNEPPITLILHMEVEIPELILGRKLRMKCATTCTLKKLVWNKEFSLFAE